jgi:probable phosphoglycerate mutase
MESRGIKWWKDVILKHVSKSSLNDPVRPEYILVVSHGGFISNLVRGLLGARHVTEDPSLVLKTGRVLNTGVTEIEVDRTTLKGILLRYSDVAHLGKPALDLNSDDGPDLARV